MKLIDILLLPGKLYANLTAKRFSMYLGIIFIGLAENSVYGSFQE